MSRVGMIGLGTMGLPMAKNLVRAGHDLTFYARRPDVVADMQTSGGKPVGSPATVAEASEFILTIVPVDRDVEEVVLGDQGVLEGAQRGTVLIDMSTISPATVQRVGRVVSESGMSMLDAPISGGPGGARNATLAIMVGGDAESFQRAKPIFEALGKTIIHCGPLGAGQTVKVINQLLAGGVMGLIGEAFAMARSAGVDLERFSEAVSASSGSSTVFNARSKFVINDDFPPNFRTELMRKDVGLAMDLAKQLGVPVPMTAVAYQQYTAAVQSGLADLDFSSVAKLCATLAGLEVTGDGNKG